MWKKLSEIPRSTVLLLCLLFCLFVIAAKPAGITQFTSIWVGDPADTADVTPAENDAFISGTLEVDGAVRLDGAIDANSTLNVSGAVTFGTAGTISATEIADVVRYFNVPLAACTVAGIQVAARATTTPALTSVDSVPALWWNSSDAQSTLELPAFIVPSTFSSGFAIRLAVSATADGSNTTGPQFGWAIRHQAPGEAFATTGYPSYLVQSTVAPTRADITIETASLILTPNATAIARINAGDMIGVVIYNVIGLGVSVMDSEIKAIAEYFTSTQ